MKTAPKNIDTFCLSTHFIHCTLLSTREQQRAQSGVFRKVGECLYRYSSNGVYYARFKTDGKEIRRSFKTMDRAQARRKLAAEKEKERQTDRPQGKPTLHERPIA